MNKLNSHLKLQNRLFKPKHKQPIMVKHYIAIDHAKKNPRSNSLHVDRRVKHNQTT